MPPTKICPQCDTVVPIRLKVSKCCQHVFPAKRKTEQNLPGKAMKRLCSMLSDNAKSILIAKDKLRKACKQSNEFIEQILHVQQQDRERKAYQRANQSSEQILHIQQQDRERKAYERANQSSEQTLHVQQQERERKAYERANQSSEQILHRQRQNKEHMASVRSAKKAKDVSVEQAIVCFHSDIKNGPDFVCTCCHCLMYRKSVIPCNVAKYSKCGDDLLKCVFSAHFRYICNSGDEYVCETCDKALKRGVMPLQAEANGLHLLQIPPQLANLNPLELRLICLRLPFMKMVALPTGKQRSIHGPAVNVPAKVDTVCSVLPRLPSQSELVPLKLKRKLAYKGHYMYDYITPQKLLAALSFLKANNPLYADIDINQEWLQSAIASDAELCECLVEQGNHIVLQPDSHNTVKPISDAPTDVAMDSNSATVQSIVHNKPLLLVLHLPLIAIMFGKLLIVLYSPL